MVHTLLYYKCRENVRTFELLFKNLIIHEVFHCSKVMHSMKSRLFCPQFSFIFNEFFGKKFIFLLTKMKNCKYYENTTRNISFVLLVLKVFQNILCGPNKNLTQHCLAILQPLNWKVLCHFFCFWMIWSTSQLGTVYVYDNFVLNRQYVTSSIWMYF